MFIEHLTYVLHFTCVFKILLSEQVKEFYVNTFSELLLRIGKRNNCLKII